MHVCALHNKTHTGYNQRTERNARQVHVTNLIVMIIRISRRENCVESLRSTTEPWNEHDAHDKEDARRQHVAGALHQLQFPAQKCRTEKKVPARDQFLRDLVHGCRIATDLADTNCTSQLRATPRCDFSRIAAGETIFFVTCVGTTTVVRL